MNGKKFLIVIILAFFSLFLFINQDVNIVYADELSDSLKEQIGNIDMSELDDYFSKISNGEYVFNFSDFVSSILTGNANFGYDSFFEYTISGLFANVKIYLPSFILVLIIALLCGLIKNFSASFMANRVHDILVLTCYCAVIGLIFAQFSILWQNCEIAIKNIANLCEIMSPIILTLMVASGANVSASVYTPSVAFFSVGVTRVMLVIVLPLVGLLIIFSLLNNMPNSVKLNKFIELISSVIKWIIGLVVSIFGIFLSVQGFASAMHDGISLKATKYAISNSIPIVGGFLKEGFDFIVAGSVLIKNAVGVASIVGLFNVILKPLISLITFSIMLKTVCAIIECVADNKIVGLCSGVAKGITYLSAIIIILGLVFFIMTLLMIMSANAFI